MRESGAPAAQERAEPAWRTQALATARRAGALLARPSAEWAAIEKEPGDLKTLFAYLAPLAAIPAAASFLRMMFSGVFSAGDALLKSILGYGTSVLGVYLVGLAIHRLADVFAAKADAAKAMQIAVYASTPIWLAGVVFLFPGFDFFFVFSLYALFLLHRGLALLMKAPKDRLTAYAAAVTGVAVAAFIVLAVMAAALGRPRLITG